MARARASSTVRASSVARASSTANVSSGANAVSTVSTANTASSMNAGSGAAIPSTSVQGSLLEALRASVYERMPARDIAVRAAENEELARNEIRGACRQAFLDSRWVSVSAAERERLVHALLDSIFGLGPLESLLEDETVSEIMVNGARSLYFEREGVLHRCSRGVNNDEEVRALIDRIIGPLGRRIDEASPMVDARLPQGHRVNAVIPPLAIDGPVLTIRKFTSQVMSLEAMVAGHSIDSELCCLLTWAVLARKNIAVSGGTGAGKTTLLNALSCVIPQGERIVTIEDSAEQRFHEHPHVVRLEARQRNAEGLGEVSIRDLVRNALRMRPDRIVVGECRGSEALEMLQAMNTGHDGSLTTLHANSPEEAIARLVTMVRYGADLPVDVIESNIANAVDLVVQICRGADGVRFVSRVVEFAPAEGLRGCSTRCLYERSHAQARGCWRELPEWLHDAVRIGALAAEEVEAWKALLSIVA